MGQLGRDISKRFQFESFARFISNSLGSLIKISKLEIFDVAKIDNIPIKSARKSKIVIDLIQILKGNKLINVISSKNAAKLILQIGPDQIGLIRKIERIINFNLQSIILNQLLLPSTYCPKDNSVTKFIMYHQLN